MANTSSTDEPAAAGDSAPAGTRLYVQNLPAYVDTARLRDHFAAQGEVTDACVIRTKDGAKSRRFGFVGFKSAKQAEQARGFFHQSFFDTCKINVRLALARESEEIARPWSKYSVGSGRYQEQHPADSGVVATSSSEKTSPDNKAATAKKGGSKEEASGEFKEFMETMQARSKTKFWANDDVQGPADAKASAKGMGGAEEADSDDEYQELGALESHEDGEGGAKKQSSAKAEELSDMDFLRSKMSKNIDNDSDDEDAMEGIEEDKDYANERGGRKAGGGKQAESSKATGSGGAVPTNDDSEPTARLFVRNLPFTAVEEDLEELFSTYGPVEEVHMPLDETKRRKGFGFVLFRTTVDAQRALTALNGMAFQGRRLHVIFARSKPEKLDPEAALADPNLTHKQRKELERQLQAQKQTGWNASFIRGDATVGSLAERMGVKRGEIMDKEQGNMAVRLAIGETMLVKENKDFFAQEGVDLNAIEGALVKKPSQETRAKKIERSTTVILIKNLPHTTEEDELAQLFRKYGEIGRFLLPPSKTLAVVEFLEPSEARKAFRSLAYKKYQHVPLYLEWAPVKVFDRAATATSTAGASGQKGIKTAAAVVPGVEDDGDAAVGDASHTLCVKNLNFATKEPALEKLFERCGRLRKVTVARRKDPKRGMLSMGFGFVEFVAAKDTERALQTLQSTVVDGHALKLILSQKKLTEAPKRKAGDGNAEASGRKSKIIVRNVAFEATSNEIRELFGAFGQLKRVRMPKKFDGKHRGFAFVEFLTEQEARNAFSALASSHLYGRHLVLEWAEDADDIETLRAKATRDLSAIQESDRRKRMKLQKEEAEADDDF
ncbi:hypothetical protein BBJ28_00015749 [Nothophytophthora sp. Chile5]|nr:hypothetical protein BBJ28_00015749 [Nothophytophthora sp. Chile5]